jgi:hypothetical protein
VAVERVGSILLGADDLVAELIASRIPYMRGKSFGQCVALGVIRNETLIGGVVYHNYVGHDCQVSIAVDRAAFMPWRALFSYPFEQLGCVRLTALIGRKNKPSRQLCERLGFKIEGVHLKGIDGRQDAISYGMLRSQCRWLKENR